MRHFLLTLTFWLTAPVAQASWGTLETKLRSELDQMFYPEQYALSISSSGEAGTSAQALPGLSGPLGVVAPGAGTGEASSETGSPDVLVLLDARVSKERFELADLLIRRLLRERFGSDGFRLQLQQRDILKVFPKELVRPSAPEPAREPAAQVPQPQVQTPAPAKASDEEKGTTAEREPQPPQPNLLQTLFDNPKSSVRLLVASWTALASLLALGVVLWRLFRGHGPSAQTSSPSAPERGAAGDSSRKSEGDSQTSQGLRGTMSQVQSSAAIAELDIVREDVLRITKEYPEQIARILSFWMDEHPTNAEFLASFVVQADFGTLEKVALHLGDGKYLDLLDVHGLFSSRTLEESIADIGKMRLHLALEIARMNSGENDDKREDPIADIKMPELVAVLKNETPETLAAVAIRLPQYKLGRLFREMGDFDTSGVMSNLKEASHISDAAFASIAKRIHRDVEEWRRDAQPVENRCAVALQLLQNTPLPEERSRLASDIAQSDEVVFGKVVLRTVLPETIISLPARALSVLCQTVDAETFGCALSGVSFEPESFTKRLPLEYQPLFAESLKRKHPDVRRQKSWALLVKAFEELSRQGAITEREVWISAEKTVAMKTPVRPATEPRDDVA